MANYYTRLNYYKCTDCDRRYAEGWYHPRRLRCDVCGTLNSVIKSEDIIDNVAACIFELNIRKYRVQEFNNSWYVSDASRAYGPYTSVVDAVSSMAMQLRL